MPTLSNRIVVDTNVGIVANGRPDPSNGGRPPSLECRLAAIEFLEETLRSRQILVDLERDIESEYRNKLNPSGQPGVGDRFYQVILMSLPSRVQRLPLPRTPEGEFVDFPEDQELKDFDPSDRKFVALARREQVPVANATDTDWLHARAALERNGIAIEFICGCDDQEWFAP